MGKIRRALTNIQIMLGFDPINRNTRSSYETEVSDNAKPKRKRLVIVGGGWAGVGLASRIDVDKFDVVLLSDTKDFVFTPYLRLLCSEVLTRSAVVEPIESLLSMGTNKSVVQQIHGSLQTVDIENKCIKYHLIDGDTSDSCQLEYDKLVLAVGSQPKLVRGVQEYAMCVKNDAHVIAITQKALEIFKSVSKDDSYKPRIVVVGGGSTGTEILGALIDLADKHLGKDMKRIEFVLVNSGDRLLPGYHPSASQFLHDAFTEAGVYIRYNTKVNYIEDGELTIKTDDVKSSDKMKFSFLVWAAGIEPAEICGEIVKRYSVSKDELVSSEDTTPFFIQVNPWLQVENCDGSVYALGDCVKVRYPPVCPTLIAKLFQNIKTSETVKFKTLMHVWKKDICLKLYPYLESLENVDVEANIAYELFEKMILSASMNCPAPSAQLCSEQSQYLAQVFNDRGNVDDKKENWRPPPPLMASPEPIPPPFNYKWKGGCSSVCRGQVVVQIGEDFVLRGGIAARLLYSATYMSLQPSVAKCFKVMKSYFFSS